MRPLWRVGVIVLLAVMSLSPSATPRTAHAERIWLVCSSGCDFTTIQEAISSFLVQDGDAIAIEDPGKHTGFVDATKSLTIYGDAPGTVTITSPANQSGITIGQSGATSQPTVSVHNLTIAGADFNDGPGDGGGILNYGDLTVANSAVSRNNIFGRGGGIENLGTVRLSTTTIQGNTAGRGGGIDNTGTLTVDTSVISGNLSTNTPGGGGIFNDGTITVNTTTVSGNSAVKFKSVADGGGIFNDRTLTVLNSTIDTNDANDGAGIYNNSSMTVVNSTISGNNTGTDDSSDDGGGIYNTSLSAATLINSTISNNTATRYGGGIYNNNSGSVTMGNTVLAGNHVVPFFADSDCQGSLTDAPGGHNLLETSSGCGGLDPAKGDLFDVDPALGSLQDYGGPTLTSLPMVGSPVVNAGDDATCAELPVNGADQRGVARPMGSHCDIGAVEFCLPIARGWTLLDLPSQTGITSASGLVTYLKSSSQSGAGGIRAVSTYANGRFSLYVPGYSSDVPLQSVQGIFILSMAGGTWLPGGPLYASSQQITLQAGWNLVAAPVPASGLDGDTIRSEITPAGNLKEIAIYTKGRYQTYLAGAGGTFHVPATSGMWIDVAQPTTWSPT